MRKNTSDQAGRALEFYPNFIEIMEFADMPPVESLKAVHYNNNYVNVYFSNGWKISMRLHTTNSRKNYSIRLNGI